MKVSLLLYPLFAMVVSQHDPHYINGKNTIVHLFEWKWSDIASECESWLSENGFGGVQISPPNENAVIQGRPWWEKYQPVSYVLSNRNGDEKALADMIKRCNKVGIRIYADVVANHMAFYPSQGTADSNFDPLLKSYPAVPYSAENFHETCDIDYRDATSIRNCELNGLKDLDQSQDHVQTKIKNYMNHLISLGVAGFRIDAAKHMWPEDLKAIFRDLDDLSQDYFPSGLKPFIYQEVINTDNSPINNQDYTDFGRVCEFKYGQELANCFRGNNPLKYLQNWGSDWGLVDGKDALIFIDNHDTERDNFAYLNYKEAEIYRAAIAFMLAHPYEGLTKVMSSYDFDNKDQAPPSGNSDEILSPTFNEDHSCNNGWICQHRWKSTVNMIEFKNCVSNTQLNNWWVGNDNQIAFSRGNKGMIAISLKEELNANIPTQLDDGIYCDIISGSFVNGFCTGKTVIVSDGRASIRIEAFEAVVAIHAKAKLKKVEAESSRGSMSVITVSWLHIGFGLYFNVFNCQFLRTDFYKKTYLILFF